LPDVDEDVYAPAPVTYRGSDAGDEAGVCGRVKFRQWADLRMTEREHVTDRINNHPDHAPADVQNDDDGQIVVLRRLQGEFQSQVKDRRDATAQVDHAFDENGRIGNTGWGLIRADLVDLQNVDAILFRGQPENQELSGQLRGRPRVIGTRPYPPGVRLLVMIF
jgi:hypothetical protein